MPWKVVAKNGQYCVVKRDTGAVVHCHPTRKKALAQLRALYANTRYERK